MDERTRNLQEGYSKVAGEYARRIYDELRHKPLDRQLLDQFAQQVRGLGPVCDLGCGPGQVARYLSDLGLPVFGLDLSDGMLAEARRLNPDLDFMRGNMLQLDINDEAWGGIVAFYSLIHAPREQLGAALQELWRVLRPGGLLLLSVHIGEQDLHVEELWDEPVSLEFCFFQPAELERALRESGFAVERSVERDPYPEVEYQSRRCYILARKSV
jgi:SAM-dependent methyltransferase